MALLWLLLPGWMIGREMFRPLYVHGPENPTVATVNRVRAAAGAVLGVGIWAAYSRLPWYLASVNALTGYFFGVVLALPLCLAVIAAVVLATRPPRRREALARMRSGPLASILLMFVVFGVLACGVWGDLDRRLDFLPKGVFAYVNAQLVLLVLGSGFYVWVHGFRAVDGNPLLRPLLIPLFAWAGAVVNLFLDRTGLVDPSGVPVWLALATSFGGAALVTALAVWEYRRVSQVLGTGLRAGPPPLAPSHPADDPVW